MLLVFLFFLNIPFIFCENPIVDHSYVYYYYDDYSDAEQTSVTSYTYLDSTTNMPDSTLIYYQTLNLSDVVYRSKIVKEYPDSTLSTITYYDYTGNINNTICVPDSFDYSNYEIDYYEPYNYEYNEVFYDNSYENRNCWNYWK